MASPILLAVIASGAMLAGQSSPSIVSSSDTPGQPTQEFCREKRPQKSEANPSFSLHSPAEEEPFPLRRRPPSWPRGKDTNGCVDLKFTVGVDGRTKNIEVLNSTGTEYSDEAIRAVKEWRYCPAFRDGVPVESETRTRLEFILSRPAPPATDALSLVDPPPHSKDPCASFDRSD